MCEVPGVPVKYIGVCVGTCQVYWCLWVHVEYIGVCVGTWSSCQVHWCVCRYLKYLSNTLVCV